MQSIRILQSNTHSSTDSLISSDRIVFRLANPTPYAFACNLPNKTLVFCPHNQLCRGNQAPSESSIIPPIVLNVWREFWDSRVLSRQSKNHRTMRASNRLHDHGKRCRPWQSRGLETRPTRLAFAARNRLAAVTVCRGGLGCLDCRGGLGCRGCRRSLGCRGGLACRGCLDRFSQAKIGIEHWGSGRQSRCLRMPAQQLTSR
jgi:hypothetical protein